MSSHENDLLRMDFINSLGQLYADGGNGFWWPVLDVCVETGLMRIDVCGLTQRVHFGDFYGYRDDSGTVYDAEQFYIEEDEADERSQ